ncbi:MAG: hypothetical protein GY952_12855 [Rhodobacteraceae bacterium]|nr:hypothetical protein [Paracoccaceae bacterium]
MKKLLIALTICGMTAGCGGGNSLTGGSLGGSTGSTGSARSSGGGSSAGSFGLFPNRQNKNLTPAQKVASDHGNFVPVVSDVRVEPVKAGAIIRVTAKASRQGYYDVVLLAPGGLEPDENGVITLELRAKQPEHWTPTSTERSRKIVVGRFISIQKLRRTRAINVIAAQNQITVGR